MTCFKMGKNKMTNRTGVKDKNTVYQMGKICLRKKKAFQNKHWLLQDNCKWQIKLRWSDALVTSIRCDRQKT